MKEEFYWRLNNIFIILYVPIVSLLGAFSYVKACIQSEQNWAERSRAVTSGRSPRSRGSVSTRAQQEKMVRFLALFLNAPHDSSFLHASYALRNRFPRNETNAFS